MTVRIVYAFDPMCGWCFAFRTSIRALRSELGSRVEWTIASSGLIAPEQAAPIGKMREALLRGMPAVEKRTQVRFGAAFKEGLLAKGTWVASSEPGCRAIFCASELDPDRAFDFAEALSAALYEEGEPQDSEDTLRLCAEDAGIDPEALLAAYRSEDAKRATLAAFAMWRQRGITTYPGIFIERNDKLERIFEGYLDADVAIARTLAALH
ncbi:MAG: DsbA family protein [Polyangiaceae bacterium]